MFICDLTDGKADNKEHREIVHLKGAKGSLCQNAGAIGVI